MPEHLSPRARGVLERYRASDCLSAEERQRLLDTVLGRAARGDLPIVDVPRDVGASGMPGSVVRPVRSWWATPVGKGAALLGASGLAFTAWVGVHRSPAKVATSLPNATSAAGQDDTAPTSPSATLEAAPAALVEAPPPTVRDPRPPPAKPMGGRAAGGRRTALAPVDGTRAPSEGTIDAEVRLIAEAQSAQSAGNPRRALQLLDEHASRFPNGKLADARAVARMIALCSSGQRTLAREEARSFLQRYPQSPFAGRVTNICGQDDDPARR